jgi:hypothetical protein
MRKPNAIYQPPAHPHCKGKCSNEFIRYMPLRLTPRIGKNGFRAGFIQPGWLAPTYVSKIVTVVYKFQSTPSGEATIPRFQFLPYEIRTLVLISIIDVFSASVCCWKRT